MGDSWTLDRARSTIEIRTYAEGMLSAAAHNLSLICEGVEAEGRLDPLEATFRFSVDGLRVRGVVKNGVVQEGSPTGIERREIERRIRDDVFPRTRTIEVTVRGSNATVQWNGGRTTVPVRISITGENDRKQSRGEAALALNALGVKPIYGPLRAFHVRDTVEVRWDVQLVPASAP